MSGVAVCSIFSQIKSSDKAKEEAQRLRAPFYIVSGMYGLVPRKKLTAYQEYGLSFGEVDVILPQIIEAMKASRLRIFHFYLTLKPRWEPYLSAMRQAADSASVTLVVHYLTEDT